MKTLSDFLGHEDPLGVSGSPVTHTLGPSEECLLGAQLPEA